MVDPTTMKFKERRIFMFEQIIIVSEMLEKKKGFSNPVYMFTNSFQVSAYVQGMQLNTMFTIKVSLSVLVVIIHPID